MSRLQYKLIDRVLESGLMYYKTNATGYSLCGMPDVIIFGPEGRTVFAEVKEPRDRLSDIQRHVIQKLEGKGFKVFIIRDHHDIESVIDWFDRETE